MALEVELRVYDGPLDLLLGLIEKNKINIFDIPIVEITDQYLAYVARLPEEDLDVTSEFMVMAADLIAIKCKMLLPDDEEEDGEEVDPREELVRRLLEYKTYKYMSYELKDMAEDTAGRYFRGDLTPPEVKKYRPKTDVTEIVGDMQLSLLKKIFDDVLKRREDKTDPIRSRFGTIAKEEVSLPDKLDRIIRYAKKKKGKFSFRELLEKETSRMQLVVTFLAVLTLMGNGIVTAAQGGTGGDIELSVAEDADLDSVSLEEAAAEFAAENGEDA